MSAVFFPAKRLARQAFSPSRFIPRGGLALPDFPGLFKKSSFKMADSQSKTRTKALFFEEILINIPSENLPRLSKKRMQYLCHALNLNTQQNRSTRTKDDYKFSTAKDPLFNSTRICKVSCKVEDHWQEHGCDCVPTDGNLGMLEQNLKGQYKRAYLNYSHCAKE